MPQFPLLTLNRQMVAARPEMCIIEKVVVTSTTVNIIDGKLYRYQIFPTPLPAYFNTPSIKDPRADLVGYSPY